MDIFAAGETGVEIVQDNLDECVLCELCIRAAPQGAIRILKLYSGKSLPPPESARIAAGPPPTATDCDRQRALRQGLS